MTQLNATEAFFRDLAEKVKGPAGALAGKKALVIGIANDQSIAYGCALAFRALGASVAMTYLNEKSKPYTQALADHLGVDPALYLPCDVRIPGQLEAVFEAIRNRWGQLDIGLLPFLKQVGYVLEVEINRGLGGIHGRTAWLYRHQRRIRESWCISRKS